MSKELTPLENFEYFIRCFAIDSNEELGTVEKLYAGTIKVIKSALKRLENYEKNEDFSKDVINYAFLSEKDKIKKLRALEIIKDTKVCVMWLRNSLSSYNSTAALYDLPILTQEEYDLLKEVLL